MGDTGIVLLPFVVFFGVFFLIQSNRPQTCPHCGASLAPGHAQGSSERRPGWVGLGFAAAIALGLALVGFLLTSPATLPVAVPPPVALPKGPPS